MPLHPITRIPLPIWVLLAFVTAGILHFMQIHYGWPVFKIFLYLSPLYLILALVLGVILFRQSRKPLTLPVAPRWITLGDALEDYPKPSRDFLEAVYADAKAFTTEAKIKTIRSRSRISYVAGGTPGDIEAELRILEYQFLDSYSMAT